MEIIEGTTENFEELVNREFVLVKFFAPWCGPCKMLTPIVDEVAAEENITVVTIDIDNEVEIAAKYAVMSVPTLMIFVNGKCIDSHMGFMPKASLCKWIEDTRN